MKTLIESVVRPVLAAVMAVIVANCDAGCIPPGGEVLEKAYNAELLACVANAKTPQDSCLCRLAVDEKYGLCDRPDWPRIGRCDYRCGG